MSLTVLGPQTQTPWVSSSEHRAWLTAEAKRQLDFFAVSARPEGGFYTLNYDGTPLPSQLQELHTTTRLVHSYAMAHLAGYHGADAIIDQGMAYLWKAHRDEDYGGYVWGVKDGEIADGRKLAYGHVFVLLAGASAKMAGHPDADRLIEDATSVLDFHFWQEDHCLFLDEWNRDWTPFSSYRGMNANMHGVEALLAAYEATGREVYLKRAGRILDFFMRKIAGQEGWRIPEHYTAHWQIDRAYDGDPMFRPKGTTPGHSVEWARLLLQYWDLVGRPDDGTLGIARQVVYRALEDAWDQTRGGLAYTLNFDGTPDIADRYWWPVTEAIGVLASLIKIDPLEAEEGWYRRLWQFADQHFIDHDKGGWFPEINADGKPMATQFAGKPDIYHALQATMFPLTSGVSRYAEAFARSPIWTTDQ